MKIGWTAKGNADARLSDAQTYHPSKLIILAETPAYAGQETILHNRLRAYKVRREWFRYEGLVSEFVEYLASGSVDTFLEGLPES